MSIEDPRQRRRGRAEGSGGRSAGPVQCAAQACVVPISAHVLTRLRIFNQTLAGSQQTARHRHIFIDFDGICEFTYGMTVSAAAPITVARLLAEHFGGQKIALARAARVSKQAVQNWGKLVPAFRVPYIVKALHGAVQAHELRPDLPHLFPPPSVPVDPAESTSGADHASA